MSVLTCARQQELRHRELQWDDRERQREKHYQQQLEAACREAAEREGRRREADGEHSKAAEKRLQEELQAKERELDHVNSQLTVLSLRADEAAAHLELTVRRWEEERVRWQRELADTTAVAQMKVHVASCQAAASEAAFEEERKRLEREIAAVSARADEGIARLERAVRQWEERRRSEDAGMRKREDALKNNVSRFQHSLQLSEDTRHSQLSELEAQRERERLAEIVRAAERVREKERETAREEASNEVHARLASMDEVCMRADDAVMRLAVALRARLERAIERERILEEKKEREMQAQRQAETETEREAAILAEKAESAEKEKQARRQSEEARIITQRQLERASERADAATSRLECALLERETAGAVLRQRLATAEAAARGRVCVSGI